MRYSVYNYGTRKYDVYEDDRPGPTHAPAPPLVSFGGIGETPEGAAWRLPAGARKVASTDMPQGRIASLGDLSSSSSVVRLGAAAALAYLAWKVIR